MKEYEEEIKVIEGIYKNRIESVCVEILYSEERLELDYVSTKIELKDKLNNFLYEFLIFMTGYLQK